MPLVHFRLKCQKPKSYSLQPQTIGEHIRKRRIDLGLSQPQAAERMAVSVATVLNWEKGKNPPLTTRLSAVITFLGYYPFPEAMSVSERLLQIRRIHGWSINRAAIYLGVDPTTWRDWEHGDLILFREHRGKVAQLLGINALVLDDEMRTRWNGKHLRSERRDPQ